MDIMSMLLGFFLGVIITGVALGKLVLELTAQLKKQKEDN